MSLLNSREISLGSNVTVESELDSTGEKVEVRKSVFCVVWLN